MIRVRYMVNYELFTAYFTNKQEMLEYEHSVLKDGETISIFEPEKRVTIFDVQNDDTLTETEKLEIIIPELYPDKKFNHVWAMEAFAKTHGLIL